jgi:hypothetical protein
MGFIDRLTDIIDKFISKIPGLEDKLDSIFGDPADLDLVAMGQRKGGFIGKILQYIGKKEAKSRPSVKHSWYRPGTVIYNPKKNPPLFAHSAFEQRMEAFVEKLNARLRGWSERVLNWFTLRNKSKFFANQPASLAVNKSQFSKMNQKPSSFLKPFEKQVTAKISEGLHSINQIVNEYIPVSSKIADKSTYHLNSQTNSEIPSESMAPFSNLSLPPPPTSSEPIAPPPIPPANPPPQQTAIESNNTAYAISTYKNLEIRMPASEIATDKESAKKIYKAVNGEGLKFLFPTMPAPSFKKFFANSRVLRSPLVSSVPAIELFDRQTGCKLLELDASQYTIRDFYGHCIRSDQYRTVITFHPRIFSTPDKGMKT